MDAVVTPVDIYPAQRVDRGNLHAMLCAVHRRGTLDGAGDDAYRGLSPAD